MLIQAIAVALVLVLAPAAAAQPPRPLAEGGRQVFMQNGCHGCHTIGAFGTPIGPDLSRVGAKYDRGYLERWLRNPAATRPRAHMQALELSEDDIRTLTDFLASLR